MTRMPSEIPADMENHLEPPAPDDQISPKFSIWFSFKWIVFNMLAWHISVICVDYFIDENQIISLAGFLSIFLPITQWLLLLSYGDWGLSWVLVNAATVIILFSTIAISIFLSVMCFPLTIMIVIVVIVGFGAVTTTVMTIMPELPAWVPSPLTVSIISVVFGAAAFFLSIDKVGLVKSAMVGGFLYSIIAPGFILDHSLRLWWRQFKKKKRWDW